MADKRERLAARRRALGFTQESLAERLGVHPTTVRRWESGDVSGPHPWIRAELAKLLQVSAEELEMLLAEDRGLQTSDLAAPADREADAGPGQDWPVDFEVLTWVAADDEDDVNRRALFRLLGGAALSAPFAGHLEHLRRGLDAALGAPVGAADIEEWEHTAERYASEVGYLPPAQVFPALMADLSEVQTILARVSDPLRPRMAHVCGQLSALAAIGFVNLGEQGAARRYWRTSVRAADQSGDPALQAWVRGKRAVFTLYEPSSCLYALSLAEEAIAAGRDSAYSGVASGYAARAQALALLGRHEEARAALGDLDNAFTRLPASTLADVRSQWGWPERKMHHVQSWVHSHAGRLQEAAAAQEATLALYPASSYLGPTQVQLHRAMCIVVAGDPAEGARQTVRSFQELPQCYWRDVLVRRTAVHVLDMIPERAHALPAVAEARELIALASGPS